MKEIQLTQGKVVLVDDEDFDYLNQWKWYALKCRRTYYAKRSVIINNKGYVISMHRLIMNTPKNMQVDHKDHNGLNCQKNNMRNCTKGQNCQNRQPYGKSKYLGVSYNKNKYIIAQVVTGGRNVRLGTFKTEEDAARAYDQRALKSFGEFANLNFKNQ